MTKQKIHFNNIMAPSHQLRFLVLQYINEFGLKIYNGNIYKLQKNSTYTYKFFISLLNLQYELSKHYNEYFDLIVNYYDTCHNFWSKNNRLDNTDFNNFRYIEYKDFVLDLNNGSRLSKENFTGICFCYFNLNFEDFKLVKYSTLAWFISEMQGQKMKIAEREIYDPIYEFEKIFGSYLCNISSTSNDTTYLYKSSNNGLCLVIEKFLNKIYGSEHIRIIDGKTETISLKTAYKKKILILNEYDYKEIDRTILLQMLDEKIIPFNFTKEDQKETIIDFSKKKPIMTNTNELIQLKIATEKLSSPLKEYYSYQILLDDLKKKYKNIILELPVFIYYSVRAYHSKDNDDYIQNTVWEIDHGKDDANWLKNCDVETRVKYWIEKKKLNQKKDPLGWERRKKRDNFLKNNKW